jgi:alcohol dehydrogenase class IV
MMCVINDFEFPSTNRIVFGWESTKGIGRIMDDHKVGKFLVCTDQGIVKAGLCQSIVNNISSSYVTYDEVEENPPITNVEEGLKVYLENKCDGLLAIGGGSSIDTAKAIGILVTNEGSIVEYEGMHRVKNEIPTLIAIPTTYGTGSEATSFSVITDKTRKCKMVIGSRQLLPRVAILDPTLFLSLPSHIGAATGMDALTHAIESYTSTLANPITEALALHSIKLVSENLREAVSANQNLDATANMVMASTLAGMAFEHTALGIVHAVSQSLGGFFNTPHGVGNAVFLANAMEFNLISCQRKYADIASAMGETIDGLSLTEAARKSVQAVRQLAKDVGIPENLKDLGVMREAIPGMAKDAAGSGNLPVNPRKVTLQDIINLYEKTF